MKTIVKSAALVLVGQLWLGGSLQAAFSGVSYTVSGTSGDYTLDFTVDNTLSAGQDIYFFGVELSQTDITGSPATFGPYTGISIPSGPDGSWNNSTFGGSSIIYNNVWSDGTTASLPFGTSLSGFDVTITDATAPTSVNWFAFGYGGSYTGGGNFYGGPDASNPGFEGVASLSAVPEPTTMISGALLLLPFGSSAVRQLRKKLQAA